MFCAFEYVGRRAMNGDPPCRGGWIGYLTGMEAQRLEFTVCIHNSSPSSRIKSIKPIPDLRAFGDLIGVQDPRNPPHSIIFMNLSIATAELNIFS
jgi:hypothetical protein